MIHNLLLLGETILFSYVALVIGEVLLRWFSVQASGLRRFAYALLAGYGAIGFGGMLLGIVGAFTSQALWSIALFILVLTRHIIHAHWVRVREFRIVSFTSLFKSESRGVLVLRAVMVVWLVVNFFIVFVPITGHDTLDYHLPVMQSLVKSGALDLSTTSFTPLPVFGEVLYAVPIAMFHEVEAPFMFQLFQYIVFVLFLIIVYAFLKDRTKHSLFSLLGVLGMLSLMDLWREVLHGGYVDVIGFVYGMVSMLIVVEYAARKEAEPSASFSSSVLHYENEFRNAKLSALFLGFAVSIKYTGLIFGAFNGIVFMALLWRHRERFRHAFGILMKYALLVAVVAGFWYAKNAVVFQNPIYPLGSNAQATTEINFFLVDPTLPNLIIFPFVRYAQWFVQDRETSSRLVVLGYLILMYALLALVLFLRRKLRTSELILTAFIHFYFIILFFLSHQYRFLLPATMGLPILLVLLGDTVLYEWQKRLREGRYRAVLRGLVVSSALASILLLAANFHYFEVKFRYIVGEYTKAEYILEIGGQ